MKHELRSQHNKEKRERFEECGLEMKGRMID